MDRWLLIFPLLPIVTALLLALPFSRGVRDWLAGLTAAALAFFSIYLIVLGKDALTYNLSAWQPPLSLTLAYDSLSALMLLVINVIGLLVTIFSIEYMKDYKGKTNYYILLMLLFAGMNNVVLAGDIFCLYLGLELAAVCCYALVAFNGKGIDFEASFRYQILGMLGSLLILLGIGLIYSATGSLDLQDIREMVVSGGMNGALKLALPLFLFGFGLKAAMVPFHAWLPDAHPTAPSPVSALLSGVVIKVLGIYGIIRVCLGLFPTVPLLFPVILAAGMLSMLVGALGAMGQKDFKRMLAYSSISQIGYILFGIGLGTPLGMIGALFHLFNHATFKSLYFLVAGTAEKQTGTRILDKLGGLSKRLPLTNLAGLAAAFSLAGVPPFGGFWSKFIIIFAAVQANRLGAAGWAIGISILTMVYVVKMQQKVFFGDLPGAFNTIKEAPLLMTLPMLILALACLLVGFFFPAIISSVLEPAANLIVGVKL